MSAVPSPIIYPNFASGILKPQFGIINGQLPVVREMVHVIRSGDKSPFGAPIWLSISKIFKERPFPPVSPG
jgi:hypothetical protein